MKKYTIAVAGTGYVGLSLAVLLAQHNKVYAVDIVPEKVELINNRKSPIQDEYIEKYLDEKELDLTATLDAESAYSNADFVVIAAPTNYDSVTQHFNTTAVENVIELVIKANPNSIMVISPRCRLDIRLLSGRSTTARTSSSARNSYESPRRCTITCFPAG